LFNIFAAHFNHLKNKEILIIALLAGINFTHIMDFMIMMPLGSYLMALFHIQPQQFSILISAYTFSAGFVGLISAFFVDNYDRKKLLLFGFLGFIIGTFACAFASSYETLLAARVLAGGFGGLIGAQVLSILGDLIPYERRGRAMGILMGAFSVASTVGVPLALALADKFYWNMPFLAIGFLALIIFVLCIIFIPNVRGHIIEKNEKLSPLIAFTSIIKDRNQQIALLFMFTLMMGHFIVIPFVAPYLELNYHFQKREIASMYFFGGISSIIASMFVGKWADKFGKHKIFSIFALLVIVPVFLLTSIIIPNHIFLLMVCALFFLFVTARSIPAQAIITSVVSAQQRGGFMSINSSLQQISAGIAAYISGLIVVKSSNNELVNYHYVGILSIFLSLACIYLSSYVQVKK
jgi:DHA1 family inner membrane transport protein